MSLEVHFIPSNLNYFPEDLGAVSEEQGEYLHEEYGKKILRKLKPTVVCYRGRFQMQMHVHKMYKEEPHSEETTI